MCVSYGLNETEMLLVWEVLTEQLDYLTGGNTGTYKDTDLITGWESDMAMKISNPVENNMLNGDAIYYSQYVTPAITNYLGPLSEQTFTTYTGVGEGQEENIAGRIIAQNGVLFPNQNFLVWNGEELVYTQVRTSEDDFVSIATFDGL